MPRRNKMYKKKSEFQKLKTKVNKLDQCLERKYFTKLYNSTAISYDVNNAAPICLPLQGDTETSRTGEKIAPTFLEGNMFVVANSAATVPCAVRIAIIKSKQRFIPISNLNTSTSGLWHDGGSTLSPMSQYLWNNRTHFTVVYDKLFTLGCRVDTDPTGDPSTRILQIKKRLTGCMSFQGTSTTTEQGQYYVVMTSTLPSGAGNPPAMSGEFRIHYKDA